LDSFAIHTVDCSTIIICVFILIGDTVIWSWLFMKWSYIFGETINEWINDILRHHNHNEFYSLYGLVHVNFHFRVVVVYCLRSWNQTFEHVCSNFTRIMFVTVKGLVTVTDWKEADNFARNLLGFFFLFISRLERPSSANDSDETKSVVTYYLYTASFYIMYSLTYSFQCQSYKKYSKTV
jgi:hypothetical protein